MNLKKSLCAAAAALAISPAAHAYEGWYGSIGAGLSTFEPDLDTEGSGAYVFDTNGDYDNGVGVYTAFGYAFGNGLRTELEYSYRQNDAEQFAGSPTQTAFNSANNFRGELDAHAVLLNLIYDIDFDTFFTPYIGGGVGVGSFGGEFVLPNDATFANGPATLNVSERGVKTVVGQFIAGVGLEVAENLSFDLSYRFLAAGEDVEFEGTFNGANQIIDTPYHNHSVFAGLRWNFGAPAPAPIYKDCWDGSSVPESSPCPPQPVEEVETVPGNISFPVYFGYDKTNLTSDAMTAIQNAAAQAIQNDIDVVLVSGHTDTSGSSAYNDRLSARRAQVVRDALIANGVPASAIRTEATGERNLAKPTPDGVREPLNRRAEVVISFQ
ncbi:MAG: OmpA family protein [Pseudomonadota bacterium]